MSAANFVGVRGDAGVDAVGAELWIWRARAGGGGGESDGGGCSEEEEDEVEPELGGVHCWGSGCCWRRGRRPRAMEG